MTLDCGAGRCELEHIVSCVSRSTTAAQGVDVTVPMSICMPQSFKGVVSVYGLLCVVLVVLEIEFDLVAVDTAVQR